MNPAAVAGLARKLVTAYALDAWPFALLHFVVVIYLTRSILRLIRETRELHRWDPEIPTASGAGAILSSFIRDSASLADRGFVVPVTDYSDRLDAEVENLVAEVGERTNMLLLVGIAGTLFGVFEFATRSMAINGDRLTQIGQILSESMAKAFPVGFVGLMLMLVFQLALATPVSRLFRAASEATRKALEHRGVVSRTLSDSISLSIAEAMRPVSTLGTTLSEHLQPVVTALGERLEQSLSLVKLQFGEIDQSTQRFIKATANLHQSANAMTNTSSRLEDLLKATPKVLATTEKIQQLQQQALEQLGAAFQQHVHDAKRVAETLERVGTSTEGLPAELVRQTAAAIQPVLERLTTDAAAAWESLAQDLGGELRREHAEFVRQTGEDITTVHHALRGAADEWKRLAVSSEALIAQPLQRALDGIDSASTRALATADGMSKSLATAGAELSTLPERFAERTATAIAPVFERVAVESTGTWRELVGLVASDVQRSYAEFVASSRQEVERANESMRAAAEEMRRLAEGAQASLTEPIATAIETARRETSAVMAEVSEFVRERYPAIRADMETLRHDMAAIVQALGVIERRLLTAGGQTPPPEKPADPTVVLLEQILERLTKPEVPQEPPTIWQTLLHWRKRR